MDIVGIILGIVFGGLVLLGIIGCIASFIGMDKWDLVVEGRLARAEYVPHRTVIHFDDGRMFLTRDAISVLIPPGSKIRILQNGNGAHRIERVD